MEPHDPRLRRLIKRGSVSVTMSGTSTEPPASPTYQNRGNIYPPPYCHTPLSERLPEIMPPPSFPYMTSACLCMCVLLRKGIDKLTEWSDV